MASKEIVLYRGLTPGALRLDVRGGYGEAWSWDFEYATGWARPPRGYVLEAVLHPSAKRLVLVTEPDEEGFSDYDLKGIRELADIVGDPFIYDDFMEQGGHLWDLWEPEWTKAIKDAGYDSIFTGGFDGPEEYVLNPNKLQFIWYHRVLARDQFEQYPIEEGTLERLGYVVGLVIANSD
ncbi:MAG: hypothetical protein Kow0080_09500 [Candidatus Promineifilaceae bacterium]